MADEFNKKRFLSFIKRLDDMLDRHIYIIALGGTALSLINLKDKTKDIDFFMEGMGFDDFDIIIERLAMEECIPRQKIDYWIGGEILFVKGAWLESRLPSDYIAIAFDYKKIKLRNITLKVLNPVDLVITKVGRLNPLDVMDIANLIRIYKINKQLLIERFAYFLNSYSGNKVSLQNNFNQILKEFYGEQ